MDLSPGTTIKAGSRGTTDTRERFTVRRALVVVQVALSLVLVVGAVLFGRSLRNLTTLDPGFRQENLLVVNMDLRRAGVPVAERPLLYGVKPYDPAALGIAIAGLGLVAGLASWVPAQRAAGLAPTVALREE